MQQRQIRFAGAPMTLFYHQGFREEALDIEIAIPVDTDTPTVIQLTSGELRRRTLSGVERMACLIYQGEYATLSEPYAAFGRWFAENGYRPHLPGREIYLKSADDGPPTIEIQFPIGA
jgi:effector-binding domain-containing protein